MHHYLIRALFSSALLVLGACSYTPQSDQLITSNEAKSHAYRVIDLPFFSQPDYYCGPTTLAEVANFYAINATPESIAPKIFIPELRGSLQIEMKSATRQLGLLPYTQRGDLRQLLRLIDDELPIIVLQNLGLDWLPQWHYAVVIGYDRNRNEFILHSADIANYRIPFSTFERTWSRANYWMLVPLPSNQASAALDHYQYTRAAYDLIKIGQTTLGIDALITASKTFPDQWLSFFLLGNYYIERDPEQALRWYEKGLENGRLQPEYLNNYAHLLATTGACQLAKEVIEEAFKLAPTNRSIMQTREQVYRRNTEECIR
ncbi:MAG: PA2778 family cysteine peptidase [Gammaproteobacteria bacterium]|nr:PA2778 family cysteine peptidase [Gammaproteobacteria bacterium]